MNYKLKYKKYKLKYLQLKGSGKNTKIVNDIDNNEKLNSIKKLQLQKYVKTYNNNKFIHPNVDEIPFEKISYNMINHGFLGY